MALVPPFREATAADAPHLAAFMDLAGHGLPAWLWHEIDPSRPALEVGASWATAPDSPVNFENAAIIEVDGKPAGTLIAYPVGEAPELPTVMPPPVAPLCALAASTKNSYYINTLAVYPQFGDSGLGQSLLSLAEILAKAWRLPRVTLIALENDDRAIRLYRDRGFQAEQRAAVVPFTGSSMTGDWVLMAKAV